MKFNLENDNIPMVSPDKEYINIDDYDTFKNDYKRYYEQAVKERSKLLESEKFKFNDPKYAYKLSTLLEVCYGLNRKLNKILHPGNR